MGRSAPPPATIFAPPLPSALAARGNLKTSDLPLRNFFSPGVNKNGGERELLPTPPDSAPPSFTRSPDSISASDNAPTPSSTTVEYEDVVEEVEGEDEEIPFEAVETASDISRTYGRSMSRANGSDVSYHSRNNSRNASRNTSRSTTRSNTHEGVRSTTPRGGVGTVWQSQRSLSSQGRDRSMSSQGRDRSMSSQGRDRSMSSQGRDGTAFDERGMPYVQSAVSDDARELALENRSLQQRISALQRIERDLLAENQNQAHQMASLRSHHEARRQRTKEQYREREKLFQARIQELEGRLAQQEQEILRQRKTSPRGGSLVSDGEITEWFTTRTGAWHIWADEFAHVDPKRLRSGLLPAQMLELCESVKSFVHLHDGGLPEELLASNGDDGVTAARVLLHGMLANFIVEETLQSPFWIFEALSLTPNDLESPAVVIANSPTGSRLEVALWSAVAPPRAARLPSKGTMVVGEAPNGRRLPPAATSLPSLTLNTNFAPAIPTLPLPGRKDMESLHHLLSNVQQSGHEMHVWRAQIVRTLSEGGLSLEFASLRGAERRRLADSRGVYARMLKDRFLSGAARLLLQDHTDGAGIEKMETRLIKEFDLALQFSCLIWSRQDPLRVKGLRDIAHKTFLESDKTMELCPSQAPASSKRLGGERPSNLLPGDHDGQRVIMAVQPMVEFVSLESQGNNEVTKILSKARVLVPTPKSNPGRPSTGHRGDLSVATLSPALSLPSTIYTPKKDRPSVPRKDSHSPEATLPGVTFNPLPPGPLSGGLPNLLPMTSYQGGRQAQLAGCF